MSGISVLILTKNEQQDLPGCLQSVAWSDDIHVYDSMSTDRTVEIARAHGAKVVQRPFDNWSAHQNWGLRNIPFRHEWVYYTDADERVTPQLAHAMQLAVTDPGDAVAFRVSRRDHLQGRWLRHVTPTSFYIRLFKPASVHYERLINPVTIVDGEVRDLAAHMDHFPFSKGMSHWFDRHNQYSSLEARQIVQNRQQGTSFSVRSALLEKDPGRRRYHQKELYYRLPMRPLLMFLLLYGLRRGFLDGSAGLTYALLRAYYEYMIVLKVRELDRADGSQDSQRSQGKQGSQGSQGG
ncbi:glycosyltransferase family 2 protein [Cupriavidus malaysiensis]|uniref:Glycosyl transferase family 2 n=1 Tax=Cupriavidus malaysiensis TaxID=367825 RepID=A0ABN4TPV4_9BURK|nr:glycosyltransferase family 2 protein [Cupriavidus malaysiensis]AOZ08306.1 glycosyl transferase family 2 [Cupriavidus malaysiensis]